MRRHPSLYWGEQSEHTQCKAKRASNFGSGLHFSAKKRCFANASMRKVVARCLALRAIRKTRGSCALPAAPRNARSLGCWRPNFAAGWSRLPLKPSWLALLGNDAPRPPDVEHARRLNLVASGAGCSNDRIAAGHRRREHSERARARASCRTRCSWPCMPACRPRATCCPTPAGCRARSLVPRRNCSKRTPQWQPVGYDLRIRRSSLGAPPGTLALQHPSTRAAHLHAW